MGYVDFDKAGNAIPKTNQMSFLRKGDAESVKAKGIENFKKNIQYHNTLKKNFDKNPTNPDFFTLREEIAESPREFVKEAKALYQSASKGAPIRKYLEQNIAHCADGCFIKVANANPERIAKKLSEDPKLIRLFRGESFPQRNTKAFKDTAKHWGTTVAEMKKDTLAGQWFTPTQSHATSYLSRPGQMKYVDVTPQELESFNRYKDKVNKRPVKYSRARQLGKPEAVMHGVTESFHHQIIPRYKLKEMEKAGRLKTKWDLNPLGERYMSDRLIKPPKGILEYDEILGGFVDSANPSEVVGQNQLKAWAADNPMNVKVGEAAPGILKKNRKSFSAFRITFTNGCNGCIFYW